MVENAKDKALTQLDEDEQKGAPLFPAGKNGKKPDYGTNSTVELLETIPSQIVDLKLDEVLTAVKDVDNLCDFNKCKARTTLMCQQCEFCNKRFCFKHGLPEVHGCGDAVKRKERKEFVQAKTYTAIRKEQDLDKAKKKLQGKLKDMQVARMKKSGNDSKKKGKSK